MTVPKSASGKPNRGSVDVAGTPVLVSTDALWRQSRKPSQVVALQPDDRESDRGDVRPQQPGRSLSHHVCLVIVPGVGEHRYLLGQTTLAEMVGTTRPRINFFMNRFKKLGFIDYGSGSALQVHSSLLNVILYD